MAWRAEKSAVRDDARARPVRPVQRVDAAAGEHTGPVRSPTAGVIRSPGSLRMLQRLAGNRAVTDAIGRHGTAAVVQREAGPEPAGVPAGPFRAEDTGDVAAFVVAVTDAYAPCPVSRIPEPVGNANPHLGALERRLVDTWTLVRQETGAAQEFSGHWDRLRPDLDAVGAWAAANGFDAKHIAAYRQGVTAIENRFLRWYSRQVIDSRADLADVGDPEAAYEQQLAEQFAAAAKLNLAVLDTSAKNRATLLGTARSGVKVADEIAKGNVGTGGASTKLGTEAIALALNIVAKGGTFREQLNGLQQAGLLKQGATAMDLTAFVVETTATVLDFAGRAILAAGAKPGERLLTLSGMLPDSAALKQLKSMSQALGYVTAVVGIASNTLKLIDAIDTHGVDSREFVEATGGLTGSVATLGLIATGASAAATAAVGGIITMWTAGIVAMGELGALLRHFDLQAKAESVRRMVDDAAVAAATGRRMATAWDEAQLRKLTAVDRPDSTDAKAVAVLEASAHLEIRERLLPQMNKVLADLNRFADDKDVDEPARQAVTQHLGSIAVGFGRMDSPHPYELTALCRTVFTDVDMVTRAIAKKVGHLPVRNPTS
jgi:hypothetical protein